MSGHALNGSLSVVSQSCLENLKDLLKAVRCRLRKRIVTRRLYFREYTQLPAVVVAPHPDDEILGAGGMIALKRLSDVPVHVIFLTSGGNSHKSCCNISQDEVCRVRFQQGNDAAAHIGLKSDNLIWSRLTDGQIPGENQTGFEEAVLNLAETLEQFAPAEIYSPHPFDGIPDHEAAAQIVHSAVESLGWSPRIIHYLVWAWYNAPAIGHHRFKWNNAWSLDIRSVQATKSGGLRCYLDSHVAPCGHPFCGKLPRSLIQCAQGKEEVFFDTSYEQ